MRIEILTNLADLPAAEWNALVQDRNPFLQHGFLAALERHHCVGAHLGWLPRHLVVREKGRLVAAMPLYEKHNAYGEFVFDHAWAHAYQQYGLAYYPKLVSAIPYTPASGQRLLVQTGREKELYPLLLDAVVELAVALDASSLHILFPLPAQHHWLEQHGLITRHDCQFHWYNAGYSTFEDFLGTLTAKKRKNIRQERRKVVEAGVSLRLLDGETATVADWQQFDLFYRHTFERKWGIPTFNADFFQAMAAALGKQVVLVLADRGEECIAGSLMFRSATRLYGRHWGCTEEVDSLHFEACYYQGIAYCIEQGLQVFEPGAQGEHKVPRGFVPTLTRSAHWLADERLRAPIERHAAYEREAVARYAATLQQHLPYREDQVPPACFA